MSQEIAVKKTLITVSTQALPITLDAVKKELLSSGTVEILECHNLAELGTQIRNGASGVALFSIADRDELTKAIPFFITIQKQIKSKKIMIYVFMNQTTQKVEEILLKAGCSEILNTTISTKALSHKLKRAYALLEQQGRASIVDENELVSSRTSLAMGNDDVILAMSKPTAPHSTRVTFSDPLLTSNDFWLFRSRTHARRAGDLWCIEIIGPSPSVAQWVEAGTQGSLTKWIWQPRAGTASGFEASPGQWIFYGRRPEYSWTLNRWAFVSPRPALRYLENGMVVETRFETLNENWVEIAFNSLSAVDFFPKMKATYDRLYHFSKDATVEIPWADQIDSKDLSVADWNAPLRNDDTTSEWNNRVRDLPTRHRFKTGAAAMEACGLNTKINGLNAFVVGYLDDSVLIVGLDQPLEPNALTEIKLTALNLDTAENLRVSGKVILVGQNAPRQDPGSGKWMAHIRIDSQFQRQMTLLKKAVEKRQEEIFAFFKEAKGM